MKADPLVISTVLKPWANYGHIRYYIEWGRYVSRNVGEEYAKKTGQDPYDRKKGIKTYAVFDQIVE